MWWNTRPSGRHVTECSDLLPLWKLFQQPTWCHPLFRTCLQGLPLLHWIQVCDGILRVRALTSKWHAVRFRFPKVWALSSQSLSMMESTLCSIFGEAYGRWNHPLYTLMPFPLHTQAVPLTLSSWALYTLRLGPLHTQAGFHWVRPILVDEYEVPLHQTGKGTPPNSRSSVLEWSSWCVGRVSLANGS